MRFTSAMPAVLAWALCLLSWGVTSAQSGDLPLDHALYHYIDRIDIQGLTGRTIHTDQKPYGRQQVSRIFEDLDSAGVKLKGHDAEWHRLQRLAGDDSFAEAQSRKGLLKSLYTNGRDFFAYTDGKGFALYANPIATLNAGLDQHSYLPTGEQANTVLYRNSRGVRVRGTAFKRLGFFTEITENQFKAPYFIRNNYQQNGVLWGENFVKEFDTDTDNPGFDYFGARGFITYSPAEEIRIKLGKDRAFWGNGYQSLLLSDHATDYFFLNLNTRIWKLQYVNHFTIMTDFIANKPDSYGTFPKKYAVFHELFYQPRPWLSVGLFESVVYSPTLPGGFRGFELGYMNPIIFYRSVEQAFGSPDNSMIGLSWKANFLKRFQSYGQIMLDDFNFRNRGAGTGYWGNKYGYQVGLKYINAFWVPRLDLQLEYNRVRPYTYQHFNPTANFSHYGQPLAHSLGANVQDFHLIARYQPFPRWGATLIFSAIRKGDNIDGRNFGGDISMPYTTRIQDYNNVVGQGQAFDVNQVHARLSYRLLDLDAYADLEARYRTGTEGESMSILGSFRINMPVRSTRF